MKAKLIKEDDEYVLYTQGFFKGSTNHSLIEQLNVEEGNIRYKLSKQNCDEIFGVVDVIDVTYKQVRKEFDGIIDSFTEAFAKQCINKAMELNKDKVFTIEDVKKLMKSASYGWFEKDFDKHIQSLQQPKEIEVEIVMETASLNPHDLICEEIVERPKLDSEGCLILKKI